MLNFQKRKRLGVRSLERSQIQCYRGRHGGNTQFYSSILVNRPDQLYNLKLLNYIIKIPMESRNATGLLGVPL